MASWPVGPRKEKAKISEESLCWLALHFYICIIYRHSSKMFEGRLKWWGEEKRKSWGTIPVSLALVSVDLVGEWYGVWWWFQLKLEDVKPQLSCLSSLMEKGEEEVFPHPALTFLCSVVCLFSCFNSLLTGREIWGWKKGRESPDLVRGYKKWQISLQNPWWKTPDVSKRNFHLEDESHSSSMQFYFKKKES